MNSQTLSEAQSSTFKSAESPGRHRSGLGAGLILTFGLAALSVGCGTLLAKPASFLPAIDPIVLAITLGLLVGNLFRPSVRFLAGIKYSSKQLLAVAIVLMGARLDFSSVFQVGLLGLGLCLGVITLAFLSFYGLSRVLRLDRTEGCLLAVGTAICGGSAILAVAPLLKAREEQVVAGVATVVMLGLFAMFLLPMVAGLLELSPTQYGVWAGLTIHQTPQVIAAGFAHGTAAGEAATLVKLVRICFLAPVAFGLGILAARRGHASCRQPMTPARALALVPGFILGFLALALCRTLGFIPDLGFTWTTPLFNHPVATELSLHNAFGHISSFLLIVSMAAVGLETDFRVLRKMSLRPVLAAIITSLIIGAATLLVLCLQ
ncbi:MAG: putative sulfate exporter family transporter [Opitutaceae bacterium]|nr:putative sulfate exporter family transporter [Chrysiogenetes bacterium]MCP5531359.1 putative sulfate exporter family transporter [Opitutaceae bacterium]